MKKPVLILLFLFAVNSLFSQNSDFINDSLDAYIAQGLQDWQVPGLAIVIVKDGKIAKMKGYGVLDLVSKKPVTEYSLFLIASNTKFFTATALAQMQYNKKIKLDDNFTMYFPSFRLYDSNSTKLLTIKDLLCHRIGTRSNAGEFAFFNSMLSRDDVMQRMQYIKPAGSFRQYYGYCNGCFTAAAQVIPKITGRKWEQFIQDSILEPLNMTHTYTSLTQIPNAEELATPYTSLYFDTLQRVEYDDNFNLAAATALISNVSDISHWLMFQLDSGRYNGKRVMNFDVLQSTRDINTIISSRRSSNLPTNFVGYGLGIMVSDYNGRMVYWHTGDASGMLSNFSFVPQEQLGISVMCNNDNQNFIAAIRHQVLDYYLGVPYRNRSKLYLLQFKEDEKEISDTIKGWKNRVKGNSPPFSLGSYTGHYINDIYGSLDIGLKNNRLIIKFNSHDHLIASLDYLDNGEWLVQYNNIENGFFTTRFRTESSKIISVEIKENGLDDIDPYVFVKQEAFTTSPDPKQQ
jgi:CubicO group peptidase (beta-lactamase class C family)